MSTNSVTRSVDEYCQGLWKALHKLPTSERDDFIREVRSHILERVEAEPEVTPDVLTKIFRTVGDPKELAAEYRTQAMLREATREEKHHWVLRPWVLLRVTLRWAVTSIVGLVAFLVTAIGYGCTLAFYLCALLKPFFPSRIGLWLAGQHTLTLGYWDGRLSRTEFFGFSVRPPVFCVLGTLGPTDGPVRELLGNWLIPVSLLCGVLLFLATSMVVRWFIRRFGRRNRWDTSFPHANSIPQSSRV